MSTTTNTRGVQSVFESYQRSRATFVQAVAELAANQKNIDALQSCGTYPYFHFLFVLRISFF
jgi:hypothetical protein